MVLLDDIVEVLALPNRDRRAMLGIIAFDASDVGAALIEHDDLRIVRTPSQLMSLREKLIKIGANLASKGAAIWGIPA